MKVFIAKNVEERQGGMSTYTNALRRYLPEAGVELVDEGRCDVLLHTGPHDYSGVPARHRCKSVIVVHDLIPEILWKDEHVRRERARALAAADAVIAISEWTKADLVREYGIEQAKVHVVHHGVGQEFFECKSGLCRSPFRPGRYLLYVGKRNEYKRFRWFLRAVAPFMWRHPSLRLLCTGEPFCRREWAWVVALGLLGRVRVQRFADDEMAGVYGNAYALVYPSMYEGFGLPILEAMASGCPVVCSRSACMPEIAGDAAAYFDVDDANGLRRTMGGLLEKDGFVGTLRAECVEKGRERARRFSWAKCARETAAVLTGGAWT